MDYTVHRILQAEILEWVAFPFSRVSSQPRDQTQVSCTAGGLPVESPRKPIYIYIYIQIDWWGFPDGLVSKESACHAGDPTMQESLGQEELP